MNSSPSLRMVLLSAVGFASSLNGAQVPLWELGSNPGLLAAAWQSQINGSGTATVSATAWNLSSTGSYTGVQVGVGGVTPPLAPDDRLALSLKRATGHSSTTVRLVFVSSDWNRKSSYDFSVGAASLSSSVHSLVESSGIIGNPVSVTGGGILWGTDSLAAIQWIDQTSGSPVMNLDVQSIVAVSGTPSIGRPLLDCGNSAPRVVPSSVSAINSGTLTVTPDLWRITGFSLNSGTLFALSGTASVATTGRSATETLVLRVRPAAGQTMQALDVEFLNAAWSRSSTYRFPLTGLPAGRFSEVAATTPLGSPIASTGGGLPFPGDPVGAMKLYGSVGGSSLNVDIERFSTTDANRFGDWMAVRKSLGITTETNFNDYLQGAAPNETVDPTTPIPGISGNRLDMKFLRDPRRADLWMEVEASGNFTTWTPIARSTGGAPFVSLGAQAIDDSATNAPALVTVADSQTLAPGGSRFLRIRSQATTGALLGGAENIDALHHVLGEVANGRLYQAEPFGHPPLPAPSFPTQGTWTPANWQDGNATQTGTIGPRNPRLKYTGRILSYAWNDYAEITWSGTQIEARFNGPSVAVDINGNEHYFNIVIDGDYRNMRTIRVKGRQTILLAQNLSNGPHDLLIFNRTSVIRGLARFHGLVLATGESLVEPSPRPSRRVEFIGDSITAGQVVGMREGYEGSESGENIDKDNAFLSYATLTTRALGAEGHFIAWPGIAMAQGRGYTGTIHMPAAWLKAVPMSWDLPNSPNWDFAQWQPQVVVINLFQNDMSVGGSDTGNLSRDAYVNFLKDVRLKYGENIRIFCVAGNMSLSSSTAWKQAITDAVNIFKTDTGHTAAETMFFPYKATGGHPRISEQQAMADALVPAIKTRMGW